MSNQSAVDSLPYVRWFSSGIRRADLAAAREIFRDDLMPVLSKACPNCHIEIFLELAPEEQDVITAVIWTRWRSLDDLHEAMAVSEVGQALVRLLLYAKDPDIKTFESDASSLTTLVKAHEYVRGSSMECGPEGNRPGPDR